MADSLVDQVRRANARLRALVSRTRNALAGRGSFTVTDIRAISEPVTAVKPIVGDAEKLRTIHPELTVELQTYKGNLEEIQTALEQMRVMLIARRAHIEAARGHLATLGMWNATLRLTR